MNTGTHLQSHPGIHVPVPPTPSTPSTPTKPTPTPSDDESSSSSDSDSGSDNDSSESVSSSTGVAVPEPVRPAGVGADGQFHYIVDMTKTEAQREKVAIIVESRPISRVPRVIKQFMSVLGNDWTFQAWHGKKNEMTLRNDSDLVAAMKSGKLRLYPLDRRDFDVPWYNFLFTKNATFWRTVNAKHILVFQVDSCLCSAAPKKIEDFFQFDYIGAPWISMWHGGRGGNGGLSLRSGAAMIECTDPPPRGDPGNEDGYFTQCVGSKPHYRIPEFHEAQPFSVETAFYPNPVGIHNAWAYMTSPAHTQRLLEYCPEMADARSFSKVDGQ